MAIQNKTQAEIRVLKQMLFRQRAQSDAIQSRIDELERASQAALATRYETSISDRPKATGRGRARRHIVYSDDDDDDEDEIPRPVQVKMEQAARAAAKDDNISGQAGHKRKRAATDLDVSDLNASLPDVDTAADNDDEVTSHRLNVKALKASNGRQRRRPPYPFKPLPQKQLPTPEHAFPKRAPTSSFQRPTISIESASMQQQDATPSRSSTASSSTDDITKSIQAKLQRMDDGLSERERFHATGAATLKASFKVRKANAAEQQVLASEPEDEEELGLSDEEEENTARHYHAETNNTSSTTNNSATPTPSPSHRSHEAEKKKKPKFKTAVTAFFPFKFIVSYSNKDKTEFSFHDSKDLEEHMSDFWHRLSELVISWESQAGAFWQWEVERRRGVRVCVSRALAKKRTKWRVGDDGFFACNDCAGSALPCFTWVCDEEEAGNGEFWCLPVHGVDRYAPLVKGKEIRRWINEGRERDGDGDDSGSDFGVGGFGDNGAFVPSESEDGDEDDEDEDEGESESGDDDDGVCDEEV